MPKLRVRSKRNCSTILLLHVHGRWGRCQNGKAGVGRKFIDACGLCNVLGAPKWKKVKKQMGKH